MLHFQEICTSCLNSYLPYHFTFWLHANGASDFQFTNTCCHWRNHLDWGQVSHYLCVPLGFRWKFCVQGGHTFIYTRDESCKCWLLLTSRLCTEELVSLFSVDWVWPCHNLHMFPCDTDHSHYCAWWVLEQRPSKWKGENPMPELGPSSMQLALLVLCWMLRRLSCIDHMVTATQKYM